MGYDYDHEWMCPMWKESKNEEGFISFDSALNEKLLSDYHLNRKTGDPLLGSPFAACYPCKVLAGHSQWCEGFDSKTFWRSK